MHSIPMQRFAGRVSAFAAYGLPTLPRVTASRRTLFIVAIVLLIATLHALGILNAARSACSRRARSRR
jgi:cell division protein FtsX